MFKPFSTIQKLLVISVALLASCGCIRADTTPATSQLGINLAPPRDWGTEIPFANVFKESRPWGLVKTGEAQGTLELDEHGWVKNLPPGCFADAPFLNLRNTEFPAGDYTLLYEGEGKIMLKVSGPRIKISEEKPGKIVFELTPQHGFKSVRIMSTNPNNYIRNIRILLPGVTEESFKTNPWNPVFLERWKNFNTFRFMDWMSTNNSEIKEWADRPKVEDAIYSVGYGKGVPPEMMIDLCNRLGVNPWFCIPHLASDDYVRQFATQVKRDLKPNLKAYVEYSNEVWNLGFKQSGYATEKGAALVKPETANNAGNYFYAHRSVEIFKIWKDVFGGTDRLQRVMGTWAGSERTSEARLSFEDAYKYTDVLATAPYFGPMISTNSPKNPEMAAAIVQGWSLDQLMDYVEKTELPAVLAKVRMQKGIADKYKVKMVAYEGGQHMVGLRTSAKNETLNKLFFTANRSERMGAVYKQYLDAWKEAGGGVFCLFHSMSKWSGGGSWGLLETNSDSTPKYDAVIKWNQDNPIPATSK